MINREKMTFEEIRLMTEKKKLLDIKVQEYIERLGQGATHIEVSEAISNAANEIFGENTGELTYEMETEYFTND